MSNTQVFNVWLFQEVRHNRFNRKFRGHLSSVCWHPSSSSLNQAMSVSVSPQKTAKQYSIVIVLAPIFVITQSSSYFTGNICLHLFFFHIHFIDSSFFIKLDTRDTGTSPSIWNYGLCISLILCIAWTWWATPCTFSCCTPGLGTPDTKCTWDFYLNHVPPSRTWWGGGPLDFSYSPEDKFPLPFFGFDLDFGLGLGLGLVNYVTLSDPGRARVQGIVTLFCNEKARSLSGGYYLLP